MCAIVDANVRDEVFHERTEEGRHFRRWLMKRGGRIIIGGTKLQKELGQSRAFKEAFAQLRSAGRAIVKDATAVDDLAKALESEGGWDSDDWHIIALTQLHINEVRVLYSKDIPLHEDFKKIQKGRGKQAAWIYSAPTHMRKLDSTRCA